MNDDMNNKRCRRARRASNGDHPVSRRSARFAFGARSTSPSAPTSSLLPPVSSLVSSPPFLTGANWSFSDVSNVTTASYPAITWTFNAAQTIYGYYVTDTGTNKVIWAEEFSAALNFGAGQQLSLTLNITLS